MVSEMSVPTGSPQKELSKIVLIGGPSGGGKTVFAQRLLAACGDRGLLISTDNYYRPLDHLPLAVRAAHNFDHPDAIEFDLLARDIRLLQSGRPADVPVYDFVNHTRE